MKDIKDYFTSPNKLVIESYDNKVKPTDSTSSIVEHNVDSGIKEGPKKRKQKKKKKRKYCDPAVTDVAQLLESNLKFLSPNMKNPKNDSVAEVITVDTKSINMKENELNNYYEVPKMNAFQFMMESRNRIIGANSPGKEQDKELESKNSNNNKEKLAARRQIFFNWCDQKGAIKRKRIDEEKDEIIEHKLKKRSKKLKKLLNIDLTEEERTNTNNKKHRTRKIRKLSSSSEESNFQESIVNKEDNLGDNKKSKKKNKFNETTNKKQELEMKDFKGTKMKDNDSKNKIKPTTSKNGNVSTFLIHDIAENNLNKDNTDDIQENITLIEGFNKKRESRTNKHNKDSKYITKKNKLDGILDESSQESVNFTPRTLRSWKMKIKMNINENKITSETVLRTQKQINSTENEFSDGTIELTSESDNEKKKASKKAVKIAPIFVKATPKTKEDPSVIEARKRFLMSGIPPSLKKAIEKQTRVLEEEPDIFPITQHIQQKSDSCFWMLPKPEMKLFEFSPLKLPYEGVKCEKITNSHMNRTFNIHSEVKKIDKLKVLLYKIKSGNPHYPVYKSFKQIRSKGNHKLANIQPTQTTEKRKRGRKKKNDIKGGSIANQKTETDSAQYIMWTEKYKPKHSDDIIGNLHAVKKLKNWLESWKNFTQEIISKKRRSNSSESEFETTDGDSKDSLKLPGKIIVLGGPCGSGKSTAVYAICNELGFKVIEINASSKRTGKRLLQEIQEATQSHQVRNNDSLFKNVFNSKEKPENVDQLREKRMCVLLVEDVDIVFEQDDGFISALMQLATTSKRPIIVTTSDYDSLFVQKYLGQFDYIPFLPLSSYSLSVWLQILFLCEGLYLSQEEVGNFLEYNKGDARKTLLQFQFWIQSGGQLKDQPTSIKIHQKEDSVYDEELAIDDTDESFIEDGGAEIEVVTHKNCIRSFEILGLENPFKIPFYLNLGLIWWNMSNIIEMPNFSKRKKSQDVINDIPKENKQKLLKLTKLYDSLTFTDIRFKTAKYFDGHEPLPKKTVDIKDSLELCEVQYENDDMEFVHEITHTLVNGFIKNYATRSGESCLNFAVPDKCERKWRQQLQVCENVYQDALLLSTDKKSAALDYMPILRGITRCEYSRATKNTKRGNRFRNYLRDFDVNLNENTTKMACNILTDFM